jgi:hypothetical protein
VTPEDVDRRNDDANERIDIPHGVSLLDDQANQFSICHHSSEGWDMILSYSAREREVNRAATISRLNLEIIQNPGHALKRYHRIRSNLAAAQDWVTGIVCRQPQRITKTIQQITGVDVEAC